MRGPSFALPLAALAPLALLTGLGGTPGCGADPVPCGTACPDVSGDYVVERQTLGGVCAFTPYTAPPEGVLSLAQTSDGTLSTAVYDPVEGAAETVRGPLFEPDGAGALADFSAAGRTVRLASPDRPELLDFRIVFTGSVVAQDDGRILVGIIATTGTAAAGEPDPTGGCTLLVNVEARSTGER